VDKHEGQQRALADKDLPSIGSRWKHYKGDVYTVLLVSVMESTGVTLVSYQSDQGKDKGWLPWTRRLAVWRALVSPVDLAAAGLPPDVPTPRFTRL
jgi:hypothetical protein